MYDNQPARSSDIRFAEFQWFAPWVYWIMAFSILILLLELMNPARPSNPLALLFLLPGLNLLAMRTIVDRNHLTVSFGGFFTLYRKRIPLSEIASADAVTYKPVGQFGGWGIRGFGADRALNARGNRGVQLVLQNGHRLLIGSQLPEELAEALRTGKEEQGEWV